MKPTYIRQFCVIERGWCTPCHGPFMGGVVHERVSYSHRNSATDSRQGTRRRRIVPLNKGVRDGVVSKRLCVTRRCLVLALVVLGTLGQYCRHEGRQRHCRAHLEKGKRRQIDVNDCLVGGDYETSKHTHTHTHTERERERSKRTEIAMIIVSSKNPELSPSATAGVVATVVVVVPYRSGAARGV